MAANIMVCNELEAIKIVVEELEVLDLTIGGISIYSETSPDHANVIDLNNADPGKDLLEYDATTGQVVLQATESDLVIANKSVSAPKDLTIYNNLGNVLIQSGQSLKVQDTTNNDYMIIDTNGVSFNTNVMRMNINGSTGAAAQVLTAIGDGTATWQDGGGGGSSPYGPPSLCFVSSKLGNDANSGNFDSPVKSLNQALTLCGPNIPTPGATIWCLDGSSFVETIQLYGNVTIYAPFAQIDSPGGSTIQTVGERAGNTVTFQYIQNSSGDGYPVENLTGYLTVNAVTIFPGNGAPLYNGSGNIMVLNCEQGTFAGVQNVGGGSRTACLLGINSGGSLDANCFSYYSNSLPNIT
jgi:hypothetical protein